MGLRTSTSGENERRYPRRYFLLCAFLIVLSFPVPSPDSPAYLPNETTFITFEETPAILRTKFTRPFIATASEIVVARKGDHRSRERRSQSSFLGKCMSRKEGGNSGKLALTHSRISLLKHRYNDLSSSKIYGILSLSVSFLFLFPFSITFLFSQ